MLVTPLRDYIHDEFTEHNGNSTPATRSADQFHEDLPSTGIAAVKFAESNN